MAYPTISGRGVSHHRQPNGVPRRHAKPIEQIFERLDSTHRTPDLQTRGAEAASAAAYSARTMFIFVMAAGAVIGLGWLWRRRA